MVEASGPTKPPGLVCTFYSYKGGVGRSMALANVGVVMATQGARVLLVDWDLEAPGLEMFFTTAAELDGDPAQMPGMVDLLEARATGTSLGWQQCILKSSFLGHSLDIISAGRRSDDYQQRVQRLDWESLFREHKIGNYVNELREEWRASYDFVLIDSRTGITDIGDICTVLLPDVLVLLFVTNRQNVDGVKAAMERAVRARSKLPVNRSKLLGVPIPARDERDREYERSIDWQRTFADEFSHLYREWLPKDVEPKDALNRLFIPYVASWSFGERIPVLENDRERNDPTSLGAAYIRLATLLSQRLNWRAIDASVSAADLAGTRVELSKAREDARIAEENLEREKETTLQVRKRTKLWVIVSVLTTLVGLGIVSFYYTEMTAAALAYKLKDTDSSARLRGLFGLGEIGAPAGRYAPDVASLLKDSDSGIRWAAASTLGGLGIDAQPFAPEVAALLDDKYPPARSAAALALGRMGAAGAVFAPKIAALLNDPDAHVQAMAASTLGRMDNAGTPFAAKIADLLNHADPAVRENAVRALGDMGKVAVSFVPNITALLKDGNANVRNEAQRALDKLGGTSAANSAVK